MACLHELPRSTTTSRRPSAGEAYPEVGRRQQLRATSVLLTLSLTWGPIPLHWQRSFAWGFVAAYFLRWMQGHHEPGIARSLIQSLNLVRTFTDEKNIWAAAALWSIFDNDPRQAQPTRAGRWQQEGGLLNVVLPSGEVVIGLLAMSWSLEELSGTNRVHNLLNKLEQSPLVRKRLSLTVIAQRDWKLESLDLKTAFLQTGEGVMEDRLEFQNFVTPSELVMVNSYRLIGDSSFWIWVEENPTPINEADQYRLIGFVGGHVDDFMRAGDLCNDTQLQVRKSIDELYAWGSKKEENFRYAGLNVEVVNKSKERYVELNQDFYLEDLPPLAIRDERLRQDPKTNLTDGEMAACRASLGALQWAATQTQIQACARVKLLLTELTVNKNMAVEKKINQLIKDLKKDPMQIRLWQLLRIDHWQQCPEQANGDARKLNTISWRSWRLKRKAISTNDGEMQATLEGEDSNFRVRFMWAQLNGCCAINDGNVLDKANKLVGYVKGIVVTDSKGVFDACNKTDALLLGMSNARSALQGYQLKEQLKEQRK
ncbi:Transposon Ty1-NL2 Gag-Pol polyprotein [Durusdinium trenchii]|uniref:Transposon Ty1-NL2 Gag-Pol polyprotein n=1 Tax=Durusdinium trenchii TaxID=1381693 RepID=A0ABP0LHA1_9DINO